VNDDHRASAERMRALIQQGVRDPSRFRAALMGVPPAARDAWANDVLGLGPPPEDGPDLPRGCVPYLPCSVDALLRLTEQAPVRASDVFVDVGSGVGRAAVLAHLLTGAAAVGLEVQPTLVSASRELAARLRLEDVSFVAGDAAQLTEALAAGTVFFLYCPFSGERLTKLLAILESVAGTREIRVCTLDLPLPPCDWLEVTPPTSLDLVIHRSSRLARRL
jgi:SAM-dependent methyltransferase